MSIFAMTLEIAIWQHLGHWKARMLSDSTIPPAGRFIRDTIICVYLKKEDCS